MKNQTLVTTLAVLLAVSLSAVVALVISSDVLDARPSGAATDTPAAIQIEVLNPATGSPDAGNAPASSAQPAAPAPSNQSDASPAAPVSPAPDTGDTTADPDAQPDAGPVAPETDTDNPDAGDADGADTDAVDDDSADMPDTPDPNEDDEPSLGEPPCDGTIIDGECVSNPIHCLIGYEWDGDSCVFVGCPAGRVLKNGVCERLVLTLPCAAGYTRLDNGDCVLDLILDPSVFEPAFCGAGLTWEDGECVSVCPPKHTWTAGFCLPTFDLDVSPFDLPNLDFSSTTGN